MGLMSSGSLVCKSPKRPSEEPANDTLCSHHPAISRRGFADHFHLPSRRLTTSAQSLGQRASHTSTRAGKHHPPISFQDRSSYHRMVPPSPSTPQFHSLDYLQRQSSSCHLRSGPRGWWNHGWDRSCYSYNSQQCRSWLEGPLGHRFHDWNCNFDRGMEGHVCGKNPKYLLELT